MAITTILGLILAVFFITASIATQGVSRLLLFVSPGSFILVFGTSFACLITNYTFKEIWGALKATKFTFLPKPPSPEATIELLVRMAVKARKSGFISLREEASKEKSHLINLGVGLLADGTDPEVTREILETSATTEANQFAAFERIWRDLSVYAPMFGMVGTIIGLVLMLRGLSDPSTIGPAMALALITTFYGIVIAGVFCLPIAGKIHNYNERISILRTISIEGLLSIQAGDNSQIVEEKLKAYVIRD